MTCTQLRPELVGYHFGEIAPETRASVEHHLLDCRDCLREYLDVKRSIETADLDARPSPDARARLRRAVAAEVNPEPVRRPWSWWERPAAFAAAGVTVLAALFVLNAVATSPGAMPHSLDEVPQTLEAPAQ